jgi:hypothetical protein
MSSRECPSPLLLVKQDGAYRTVQKEIKDLNWIPILYLLAFTFILLPENVVWKRSYIKIMGRLLKEIHLHAWSLRWNWVQNPSPTPR